MKLIDFSRQLGQEIRRGNVAISYLLLRFPYLYFKRKFSPEEILPLGLLAADTPQSVLHEAISREELLQLQLKVNPRVHFLATDDKRRFAEKCKAVNLPTPDIIGEFTVDPSGEVDDERLDRVLNLMATQDCVIKPAEGLHGWGFKAFPAGSCTRSELVSHCGSNGYVNWIVQERLAPHPEIEALSSSVALQNVRAVTVLDPAGEQPELVAAWLKLMGDGAEVDNFHFGKSGNVLCPLEPDSGVIRSGVRKASDSARLVSCQVHPVSGSVLQGATVPLWAELKKVVLRAARHFAPLCTIGWDVAITRDSVLILEGNVTWDPHPGNFRDVRLLVDQLLEIVERNNREEN